MPDTMVIPSTLVAAREVEEALLEQVGRYDYDEAATFAVKLALEEALNNAIKHGNGFDAAKTVEVRAKIDGEKIEVTIIDQGTGFNPAGVPDPTADENLEKPCGRGIMLMRAYMDEVQFNETGNRVHMVKHSVQ